MGIKLELEENEINVMLLGCDALERRDGINAHEVVGNILAKIKEAMPKPETTTEPGAKKKE